MKYFYFLIIKSKQMKKLGEFCIFFLNAIFFPPIWEEKMGEKLHPSYFLSSPFSLGPNNRNLHFFFSLFLSPFSIQKLHPSYFLSSPFSLKPNNRNLHSSLSFPFTIFHPLPLCSKQKEIEGEEYNIKGE